MTISLKEMQEARREMEITLTRTVRQFEEKRGYQSRTLPSSLFHRCLSVGAPNLSRLLLRSLTIMTTKAPKPNTVYVTCFGGVYRLTRSRWRKYLQAFVEGEEPIIENYGTYLGNAENVTDMQLDEAHDMLDAMDNE